MNPQYSQLYQQARQLEDRMHGAWDDRNHETARNLQQSAHDFREALESGENSGQIAERAKRLHEQLEELGRNGTSVMSAGDLQGFRDRYRDMHETFKHM